MDFLVEPRNQNSEVDPRRGLTNPQTADDVWQQVELDRRPHARSFRQRYQKSF